MRGFQDAVRTAAREHLLGRGTSWWAVLLRGVHHDLVGRRGRVGGGRGGERGALLDPIVITIVVLCLLSLSQSTEYLEAIYYHSSSSSTIPRVSV